LESVLKIANKETVKEEVERIRRAKFKIIVAMLNTDSTLREQIRIYLA